ncbi:fibronectin type III domain-containing protein [Cellulomonas sp. URHB0016]
MEAQDASTPYPPRGVSITEPGVDRFTIGWTEPVGGATPTGYRVWVWERAWDGTTQVLDLTVDAGTRSFVATGLKRGTEYSVDVATVTAAGLSAAEHDVARTVLTDHRPEGALESVAVIPGGAGVRVVGWALDVDSADPLDVEVRVDGVRVDRAVANRNRPDIGAAHPGSGDLHGIDYTWWWAVPSSIVGTHEVCLWTQEPNEPWQLGETKLGCRSVTIKPAQPLVGNVDALTRSGSSITVAGWSLEPSGGEDVVVIVEVDDDVVTDRWTAYLHTDVVRPDVAAAYPGTGAEHGFTVTLRSDPGKHQVCLWALREWADTATRTSLGCRFLGVDPTVPVGNFESLASTPAGLSFSGWAVDPQAAGPIDVDIHLDGSLVGTVSTTTARGDVGRAYPGTGDLHGYSASLPAVPGKHEVCLSTYDATYDRDTPLGCRTVTAVPQANQLPVGNFESLTSKGSWVTLSGWALDPDVNGSVDVHYYVDGGWGGAESAQSWRPDVGRAYPGTGDQHGFSMGFEALRGTHQVCLYAIDATSGGNTPMGCRTVNVAMFGALHARWAPR